MREGSWLLRATRAPRADPYAARTSAELHQPRDTGLGPTLPSARPSGSADLVRTTKRACGELGDPARHLLPIPGGSTVYTQKASSKTRELTRCCWEVQNCKVLWLTWRVCPRWWLSATAWPEVTLHIGEAGRADVATS